MKNIFKYIGIVILLGTWTWLAYTFGVVNTVISASLPEPVMTYELGELVTVSRSPDWKYGKEAYVAVIYVNENNSSTYDIECRVHVGDTNYMESIELGQVESIAEAMEKWGDLVWTDDSLIIGSDGPYQIIVARKQIEKHR